MEAGQYQKVIGTQESVVPASEIMAFEPVSRGGVGVGCAVESGRKFQRRSMVYTVALSDRWIACQCRDGGR